MSQSCFQNIAIPIIQSTNLLQLKLNVNYILYNLAANITLYITSPRVSLSVYIVFFYGILCIFSNCQCINHSTICTFIDTINERYILI